MALTNSKSFSWGGGKPHHNKKVKSYSTLPRPKKKPPKHSNSATQLGGSENKIGEISKQVEDFHHVFTREEDSHNRRAIVLEKREDNENWGFTLQSYGLYHEDDEELEVWTYVDYVAHDGPASKAGMRPGDVILMINSEVTEGADHQTVVDLIHSSSNSMRMVVLFQDCVKKVALHQKLLRLKNLLVEKELQLKELTLQEDKLIEGYDLSDVSYASSDDIILSSSSHQIRNSSLQNVSLQNASKLSGSLPSLPTCGGKKLTKSSSTSSAKAVLESSSSKLPTNNSELSLGAEICLLDSSTIASVGGYKSPRTIGFQQNATAISTDLFPSPQAERRYPASPSFGGRRDLKRHSAMMMKGPSPRLGIRTMRVERYSSEITDDVKIEKERVPESESDSDEAFVNLSPISTPPETPIQITPLLTLTLTPGSPSPGSSGRGSPVSLIDEPVSRMPTLKRNLTSPMLSVFRPRSKSPLMGKLAPNQKLNYNSCPSSPIQARPISPLVFHSLFKSSNQQQRNFYHSQSEGGSESDRYDEAISALERNPPRDVTPSPPIMEETDDSLNQSDCETPL